MAIKGRKIKLYTGCKTFGFINVIEQTCTDPECENCSRINKAFIEELKKTVRDENSK